MFCSTTHPTPGPSTTYPEKKQSCFPDPNPNNRRGSRRRETSCFTQGPSRLAVSRRRSAATRASPDCQNRNNCLERRTDENNGALASAKSPQFDYSWRLRRQCFADAPKDKSCPRAVRASKRPSPWPRTCRFLPRESQIASWAPGCRR